MKSWLSTAVIVCCLATAGCSSPRVFSSEVMQGVDPNFDFGRWKMMPNQAAEKKIMLGGRIIQADAKEDQIMIVVAQLPIVEHPAYGPKDTGRPSAEFSIIYKGKIDSLFLQRGNRLMVVGTTRAPMVFPVDDVVRSLPALSAKCLHIWNTGGRDIADYPGTGAGYEPLREETFCAST